MKHHPEQLEDEIYMGNSTPDGVAKSSWKTGRLGKIALMRNGKASEYFQETFRPWFIKVSEVEASIETERYENKPWSAERIRALQPMVDKRTVFVD